ncbi:hypothetical protein ACFPES_12595 [Paenibacillus sp. GCM10023248]|uniref:hypothetical protein n=1 Tax=unclassified Paenibacillus TaxID=185978 RepID=UPI002377FAE5|nr:hypothetical protein [Paenibacillus sp. MAHUQ-63]MDD9267867.1 hypothetical protein [Paenibacillus sp. MAHUQ-63]
MASVHENKYLENLNFLSEQKASNKLKASKDTNFAYSKYEFHKVNCLNKVMTPLSQPKLFYRRGKSSSGSQKWQCKSCKKITNVLPKIVDFNYRQKRNDVMPAFVQYLLGRTSVKQTCNLLNISPATYYSKLKLVYEKCNAFLEQNEKRFNQKKYSYLVTKTNILEYEWSNTENSTARINIISTEDKVTNYVFRSDILVEWKTVGNTINTLLERANKQICSVNDILNFPYWRIIKDEQANSFTTVFKTEMSRYFEEHYCINESDFIEQIKRRLFIFPNEERLVKYKTYRYANFNEKYAQYNLTILRTFFNYCLNPDNWNGKFVTPAQRIGLVDRCYTISDVLTHQTE